MMGRSIGAVAEGFVLVVVLSLGTDQVLHMLQVYPPWGQRMSDGLFALATGYRIVYTILGGYVTARMAPGHPMKHVMVLAGVGFIVGVLGVVATLGRPELGPKWYPIAIALTAVPCTWLGGVLYRPRVQP